MAENVIDYGRTKLKAAAFIGAAQPDPASIEDADISETAAIATSKLADGAEIAALVESDLVSAVATPAVYSVDPADLAAALVAAGLMEADDS